ncbi:hypothetical protein EIK56_13585 [Sphingomonas sp. C8-2]|jgi:carbon-monoxide dehydrogenase medium subunit|uniref:Carbon-monoxide dehydrogenase medium subunit n=1 Tax=Rhizorhabdus histidinilytica TaxID=439228 RepID=A0A1T5CYM2_9SPHN|nr:FAD binding domain-containing protein [Rhizorhabdus histidinilytica]QEH79130.1 hypothetical protein EIK56_13585 [Sphingomonas sp. C8-2]SKB64456.1 carbon-monoxide dehydrogenase medium subunit [Rhizorhabdus histidinilytica]
MTDTAAGGATPLRYSAPTTIEEMVALLAGDRGATLIAGGQSLLPPLLAGVGAATHLVDIRNVERLRAIEIGEDEIFIGAGNRFSDLLRGPVAGLLPALAEALRHVGTTTIRNRATLGGNIAWADPRAEAPMVLMLHGATVRTDRRAIPMATLPVGPFKTRLARDEVILGVTVPRRPDPAAMRFAELLDRHSAGKAVVSVAVRPAGDAIDFAIAGLLDRPVTATAPVASLDRSLSEIERSHRPLEDPFHSYRYRREMALVLLHRALAASIEGR